METDRRVTANMVLPIGLRRVIVFSCFLFGCVSSYPAPMAQAPLFTRQGEAEVGVGVRALAPRRGLMAMGRVAVTDHLRAGALIDGSVLTQSRDWGFFDGPHHVKRLVGLYGEAFFGAEGARGMLRYGGLVAGGYGVSERAFKRCLERYPEDGDAGLTKPPCKVPRTDTVEARYIRGYAQLHVGLAAHRLWRGAFGIRMPLTHDFERPEKLVDLTPQAFVSNSVVLRNARLEFQLLGARDQRVALIVAVSARHNPR